MKTNKNNITTPVAIASFPFLAEPSQNQKGEDVFSILLVFAPGSDLKEMQDEIQTAATAKFGAQAAKALRAGPYSNPLRPVSPEDCEEKGYPKGSYTIRAKSKIRPGVVTRYRGPDGKPIKLELEEYGQIYPGALVRASLSFFGYDNESKGVSAGLNGIQLWDNTTPRIDGRTDASNLFDSDLSEDVSDPFKK